MKWYLQYEMKKACQPRILHLVKISLKNDDEIDILYKNRLLSTSNLLKIIQTSTGQ